MTSPSLTRRTTILAAGALAFGATLPTRALAHQDAADP